MTDIILSPSGETIAFPPDAGLIGVIQTQEQTIGGKTYCAAKYTPRVCKLLRALGTEIPSPFALQYQWPGGFTPFEAQRATAELFTLHPRAYCLNDMGTGKTIATLAAADWLMRQGAAHRALVISPLSTLSLVWAREIFSFCPQYSSAILHGTRDQRFERLAAAATFYIVNYDGAHIIAEEVAKRKDIDLIILDELAELRTQRTRRWKAARQIITGKRWVWGLTGTPRPNAPTDVWAQAKLLTPNTVPEYFGQFRDQTMHRVSEFRWVEREEGNEIAYRALQPSVRFSRDQCVDLPPLTYSMREVGMSKPAQDAYKQMHRRFKADVEQGQITAANAGVKLSKLLQISCGWVYDDAGQVISVDAADRLKVLQECLDEAGTKVIVFVPFIHALHEVLDSVRRFGYSADLVYGETSRTERTDIFERFVHEKDPHVLVCHPRTMAHGLNFQHAATIIWFSPLHSFSIFEQANARITRPGQKNPMHVIQLAGSQAEQHVYQKLRERENAQGMLLSMFK